MPTNQRYEQIYELASILGMPVVMIEKRFTEWLRASPLSFQSAIAHCKALAQARKPMPWDKYDGNSEE